MTLDEARNCKKICLGIKGISAFLAVFSLINPIFQMSGPIAILTAFSSNQIIRLLNIHNYDYLKDIKELKSLYDQVLINFNDLKNDFNFNNNIELCTFIHYCVNNGYLSYNKNYKFNQENIVDIKSIEGAYLMSGIGVCRHISAFYKDILDLNNIENCQILVNTIEILDLDKLLKEMDDVFSKMPNTLFTKEVFEEIKKSQKKSTKYANHVINMVKENNLGYYLDPTRLKLHTKIDDKNLLSSSNEKIRIMDFQMEIHEKKDFKIYKNLSEVEIANFDSFNEKTDIVHDTCNNNIDMLDKFYHENKELFVEIKNELDKFKNKTKIKRIDYMGI
jgi:hypothetical protein